MNKSRLYWSLQIGGWLTFGILQMVGYQVNNERPITSTQVIFYMMEAGSFLLITHLFRSFLIKSGWLGLNFRLLIPRVVLSVLILGMVEYSIRILISVPLGIYDSAVAFNVTTFSGLTIIYALIAFLWCVFYLIYHYFERYNLSLKRQAEINEIELSNLKSQLNPHFIFNSLNSIRALVDEDPKKSKLAITQLSTILRSTLVSDQNMLTAFEDELLTVKNYLGLESIRYEERLKISYDIDPDSSRFQVPPLMLQTLVENGIKHGISQLKEGGEIRIRTRVDGDSMRIEIRNSGQIRNVNGHRRNKRKGGLGLINTRKRLELIYGENAHFEIINLPDGFVSTELILPINTIDYERDNHR